MSLRNDPSMPRVSLDVTSCFETVKICLYHDIHINMFEIDWCVEAVFYCEFRTNFAKRCLVPVVISSFLQTAIESYFRAFY